MPAIRPQSPASAPAGHAGLCLPARRRRLPERHRGRRAGGQLPEQEAGGQPRRPERRRRAPARAPRSTSSWCSRPVPRSIGYKAGLTNPAVQKRFNASAPVWGVLYAPMLLQDGATVDAAFGARPLFEADLLVRVSRRPHQPGEDARAGAAVHRPGDPGHRAARPGGRGAAQAQWRGRGGHQRRRALLRHRRADRGASARQAFADSLASMKVLVMGGGAGPGHAASAATCSTIR